MDTIVTDHKAVVFKVLLQLSVPSPYPEIHSGILSAGSAVKLCDPINSSPFNSYNSAKEPLPLAIQIVIIIWSWEGGLYSEKKIN